MGTVATEEIIAGRYFRPNAGLDTTEPFDQIRDARVGALAGLSVGQMVELSLCHNQNLVVRDFTLPRQLRGEDVVIYRGGYELTGNVPYSPRGGNRRYQEIPDVGPDKETHNLTLGMDEKYAVIMQELIEEGIVNPVLGVPVGGKSETILPFDPRYCTPEERQQLNEDTVIVLDENGYFTDLLHRIGPDVNMSAADMENMRDVMVQRGYSEEQANQFITGKPVEAGGIAGREVATARGAAVVLDEYLQLLEVDPGSIVRFSVQGYGNAGSPLVEQFNEISKDYIGVLVCASDLTGTVYQKGGISEAILKQYLQAARNRDQASGLFEAGSMYRDNLVDSSLEAKPADRDSRDDWLRVDADVYVPAAMAGGINGNNIHYLTNPLRSRKGQRCPIVLPVGNFGISTLGIHAAERAGVRALHHAHVNSYGAVGSIVESAMAAGQVDSRAARDPYYLYRIIDQIAASTTRRMFADSKAVIDRTTFSMTMAFEAAYFRSLEERYGRPNMARG